MKIGIVGTGASFGVAHYHTLGLQKDPRAEIAAVYNRRPETSQKYLAAHGLSARACGSFAELLEQVDAVDICTPNSTHAQYAGEAAAAGKAILLEKPLATRLADAEAAAAAVEKAKTLCAVCFTYRYSLRAQTLRTLARRELGRIYTFAATYGGRRLADPGRPVEWRMLREPSGSGALCDYGSHLLDLASYTCGVRLKTVSCCANTFIPRRPADAEGHTGVENDDACVFSGLGEKGEVCSFMTSRVGLDEIHLCIAGEGGLVRLDYTSPEMLYCPKTPSGGYTGEVRTVRLPPEGSYQSWVDAQMKAFLDACEGREADICTIGEALYTQRVLAKAEACAAVPGATV